MQSLEKSLNGADSTLCPIMSNISCESLKSGSKPKFPPGLLSRRKPKSKHFSGLHNAEECRKEQTNMNDVSNTIDHDISIVSVFDLQQITEHTISSHTSYKVASCCPKRFTILVSIFSYKILE